MKKFISITSFLVSLVLLLSACEKAPEVNNASLTLDDELRWPCLEAMSRTQPKAISKKEFLKVTKDRYYSNIVKFLCTDSLGKVCFWDTFGEPTFTPVIYPLNVEKGDEYVGLPAGSNLHKFLSDGSGCCYFSRNEVGDTDAKGYKFYWCHDGKDGTFAIGREPVSVEKARGVSQLMDLTDTYFIVRNYDPLWRGPYPETCYELQVFLAVKDNKAAEMHWNTDAELE